MREIIDAAALREMLLCANAALEENKQKINELNVFPVPDGDTGTNMSLTLGTAAAELIINRQYNRMVAIQAGEIVSLSLIHISEPTRH